MPLVQTDDAADKEYVFFGTPNFHVPAARPKSWGRAIGIACVCCVVYGAGMAAFFVLWMGPAEAIVLAGLAAPVFAFLTAWHVTRWVGRLDTLKTPLAWRWRVLLSEVHAPRPAPPDDDARVHARPVFYSDPAPRGRHTRTPVVFRDDGTPAAKRRTPRSTHADQGTALPPRSRPAAPRDPSRWRRRPGAEGA